MYGSHTYTSIASRVKQSVSFMICSLFTIKCFQETGLKNIVKKNYLDAVFLWKKANFYFASKTFWKMFSTPTHNQNICCFKISMYICNFVQCCSSLTCFLTFNSVPVYGLFINFLLLQKPHLFSSQLYFLWNLQDGPTLSWDECSFAVMFMMVYLSTKQDLITWELKRKNNYDCHKENSKYQQIYSFCIMKW